MERNKIILKEKDAEVWRALDKIAMSLQNAFDEALRNGGEREPWDVAINIVEEHPDDFLVQQLGETIIDLVKNLYSTHALVKG